MVTDLYGALLQELGRALEIGELVPDRNNSCLLRLKDGFELQIELDRSAQFVVLGADLGLIPPGKYRENLFREALKANDMPYPTHGIFAYSKKSDHLILFEKIYTRELNGEKIAALITPFAEKGKVWLEALKRGEVPVITQAYTSGKQGSGMFGL